MNLIVCLVMLSPLWLVLPLLLWKHRREEETTMYDNGSDIGISANYWEA